MKDRAAQVLRAIADIDIIRHPTWEVLQSIHRRPGISDWEGICLSAEDVSLDGDRFTALAELAFSWTCECHEMPVPDVESPIIAGRFVDERPRVETIGIYRSIVDQP